MKFALRRYVAKRRVPLLQQPPQASEHIHWSTLLSQIGLSDLPPRALRLGFTLFFSWTLPGSVTGDMRGLTGARLYPPRLEVCSELFHAVLCESPSRDLPINLFLGELTGPPK